MQTLKYMLRIILLPYYYTINYLLMLCNNYFLNKGGSHASEMYVLMGVSLTNYFALLPTCLLVQIWSTKYVCLSRSTGTAREHATKSPTEEEGDEDDQSEDDSGPTYPAMTIQTIEKRNI